MNLFTRTTPRDVDVVLHSTRIQERISAFHRSRWSPLNCSGARFLLTWLFALALAPASAAAQSHATAGNDSPLRTVTPAEWSHRADHLARCEGATRPSGDDALVLQTWRVDSLAGTIALPRDFKLLSSDRGYQWIGPDSSSISIDGVWALGSVAMSGAKMLKGSATSCAAELFGMKVPAQEFAMIMKASGDTVYFSMPGVIVKTGQGLQVMLQAHSPERRAQLLELAESLHLVRVGREH